MGLRHWSADSRRDILRGYALESLTDPEAVLVIDAEPDKQMIQ